MAWQDLGLDGRIDWRTVERDFPGDLKRAMADCVQDAVFHAEGDVWTHTRMVCERLQDDPEFQTLAPERRRTMALAAVWHDVAKPQTREAVEFEGRERITHHRHSSIGASVAWRELWAAEVPLDVRLGVHGLIMNHQRIFHGIYAKDIRDEVARFSLVGSWRELAMLGRADNRGRIAPGVEEAETNIALMRLAAEENGCLDGPWPFPSAQARLRFGKKKDDALFYDPPEPAGSRVHVMCGPPGAGKDTYIAESFPDLPVVSLDGLRAELDIAHGDAAGGRVIQAARERMREHMRRREPFVYNSTNLSRLYRSKVIDLMLAYDAHVTIHAFDIPQRTLLKQNAERASALPKEAVAGMLRQWEPPTALEAHEVRWVGPQWRLEAKRASGPHAALSTPSP